MALFSNGKQNIPPLFMEIMRLDEELDGFLSRPVIPFKTHKIVARKQELMRAAEKALRWNTDKGNQNDN